MSGRRALAIAASLVVIAVVGAGLWVNGSPAQRRLVALDLQREGMLRNIALRVELDGDKHHKVADNLDQLITDRDQRIDPVTKIPFEYTARGKAYTLCAVFDTDARDAASPDDEFSHHAAGRVCFTRALDKSHPDAIDGDP